MGTGLGRVGLVPIGLTVGRGRAGGLTGEEESEIGREGVERTGEGGIASGPGATGANVMARGASAAAASAIVAATADHFSQLPWHVYDTFTKPLESHADWEQGVWKNGRYQRAFRGNASLEGGNVRNR